MSLWKSGDVREEVVNYTTWLDKIYDQRLAPYEIQLFSVMVKEFAKKGYIKPEEAEPTLVELSILMDEYNAGKFDMENAEDIHDAIETKITSRLKTNGLPYGSLRMGISRNEDISTLMLMKMRNDTDRTITGIENLIRVLSDESYGNSKQFAGFTHFRVAMQTDVETFLDHYIQPLKRSKQNLEDWLKIYNKLPFGSGVGYGQLVEMDRAGIAKDLGFDGVMENPIDATSNLWQAAKSFGQYISDTMRTLANMSYDIKILSMEPIGVISLPKDYCEGSSLMPHKFNRDMLEITEARSQFISSRANNIVQYRAGTLFGYNRQYQAIKYEVMQLFDDAFDGALELFSGLIPKLEINENVPKELLKSCGGQETIKMITEFLRRLKSGENVNWREFKLDWERRIKESAKK